MVAVREVIRIALGAEAALLLGCCVALLRHPVHGVAWHLRSWAMTIYAVQVIVTQVYRLHKPITVYGPPTSFVVTTLLLGFFWYEWHSMNAGNGPLRRHPAEPSV